MNKDAEVTLVLATCCMDEVDYLCDRIAIIDEDKIAALDTPEVHKALMGGRHRPGMPRAAEKSS